MTKPMSEDNEVFYNSGFDESDLIYYVEYIKTILEYL